jgi:hypothetical protein
MYTSIFLSQAIKAYNEILAVPWSQGENRYSENVKDEIRQLLPGIKGAEIDRTVELPSHT